MGISSAIFESNGQRTEHYVPGVYSRSGNVTNGTGVSSGNHVIIGQSQGGEPMKLLEFSSLSEAKDVLVGGDLLKAVGCAFNCSPNYTPQKVYALRVNEGTQSILNLTGNDDNVLLLKSWDWGAHTNMLNVFLQNLGDKGYELDVVYKGNANHYTNISRPAISLVYMGEDTAHIQIDESGFNFRTTNVETGEDVKNLTISWDSAPTLIELATLINDNYELELNATVVGNDYDKTTEMDYINQQIYDSEIVLKSDLQALIDVLKNDVYIGSVELVGERIPLDETYAPAYFTGGTSGEFDILKLNDALSVLETEDIQIISTPITSSEAHTLIAAHCKEMSSTTNRKERTCILGGDINITDEAALLSAKSLNSKYASFVADSGKISNPITGVQEVVPASYIAIMAAAMESAMAVNIPLTFKMLNVLEFSKKRKIANIEKLLKGGVMVCNANPEDYSQNIVIRGLTTYQGTGDLISCERSMTREDLFMNRDLRAKFVTGIGQPNEVAPSTIIATIKGCAKDWGKNGYIIPNDSNEYVWDIKVKYSGDKVIVSFARYLTAPRNFTFISATNYVYESSFEL